jgi:glyoxylase-like metal-dependent hydrolase (beta-lactamase superfamily II)
VVCLGEEERANMIATREMIKGNRSRHAVFSPENMRRFGATELFAELANLGGPNPAIINWEDPDRWLADGTDLSLRTRTLRAVHTPGHTRGHLIYHDAAAGILFGGDHVLPHITPSIGFEPAAKRTALADYLSSLAKTLALPDARLLPAHGPVTGSVHERVNELLAHHDLRLAEIHQAVLAGHATAFEVAKSIKWTRRQRLYDELDLFSRVMSVNETAAHLEVLHARGQVTREISPDGVELYQAA